MSQIKFPGGPPSIITAPTVGTVTLPTFDGRVPFIRQGDDPGDATPPKATNICGLDVGDGCVLEVEPGGIVLEVDRF